MRVLIFHGYLLAGTGSNVYNARLAAALVGLGHEVHLLCQDRHPDVHPFVDAAGDWEAGELRLTTLRWPISDRSARCTVYRPDIGALLPVYVADRYEGIQARTFADCTPAEVASYVEANVASVREVCARVRPDLALANHLVMGPAILARALRGRVPYAVKVHGSALEYTVKPQPERFLPYAREGLAGARAVLVGSRHTAESLWRALADPGLAARTRLGPPGVDIARFLPRPPEVAAAGLRDLARRLHAGGPDRAEEGGDSFARDQRAAGRALARLRPGEEPLVAFVGKLILNKGPDLLIAAWPLVLGRVPDARLLLVGFGADRAPLERLLETLARGALDGAQNSALPHLRAFLGGLHGDARAAYLAAARRLPERVVLTGRLDHEELAELLPACEALVVPSTFPESFGMVAVEAAACGALPISAEHSGLAEVSRALARAVPPEVAPWLSFPLDTRAVPAIAERVIAWLQATPELRERARAGLVQAVRARWSWEGVARAVITAAQGRLEELPSP